MSCSSEEFLDVHFFAAPELLCINKSSGLTGWQVERLSFLRCTVKMLLLSSIFLIMVLIQTKLMMLG
jgi:hypothetical protein